MTIADKNFHFSHDAMNTTFHLHLRSVEKEYAIGMAKECFDFLDFMEAKFSRFVPESDISRIHHLRSGETLYISEITHRCLLESLEGSRKTHHLFDVTFGSLVDSGQNSRSGRLIIHPDMPAVTCEFQGSKIDLGGIAKGFALDQLKQTLAEWGASEALLSAGASSHLAFGQTEWNLSLTGEENAQNLYLRDHALSASGTEIQGNHIVHPFGINAMPDAPFSRVWVNATTATCAEIWSTALMLVSLEDMKILASEDHEISSVFVERKGEILRAF